MEGHLKHDLAHPWLCLQMPDLVEGVEKMSLGASVPDPEYSKEQRESLEQVLA